MAACAQWKTLDRYDRHVRRARLCATPRAPVQRLSFLIEEALRLASLPGENEGRCYYFRRLRVTGLPDGGDRRQWLENFQRSLAAEARHAIHGADSRAASANAAFFHGEPEALEMLLHRVASRQPVREWFWPMVAGRDAPAAGKPPAQVVEIVERLRDRPASWTAVAAAFFASGELPVVGLLEAIPEPAAERWLRELTGSPSPRALTMPRLPERASAAVEQASRVFGFSSPRVLWLATLAVLFQYPSEMAGGTAVWRAQVALRELAGSGGREPAATFDELAPPHAATANRERGVEMLSSPENGGTTLPAAPPCEPAHTPGGESAPAALPAPAPAHSTPEPAGPPDAVMAPDLPGDGLTEHRAMGETSSPAAAPASWHIAGLPTGAAGLFFLLNVLRRLGMPEALTAGLAAAGGNFAARVLRHLAAHAGAAPDDPVTAWLDLVLPDGSDDSEAFPCDASCWPANLPISRSVASRDDLVRAWSLAVRRWCWRAARISVHEAIARPGVFSVNRTDLDVSLAIEQADIRIRRAGLDLDPGWLPWFGRVVRFHYLFRGEFHA